MQKNEILKHYHFLNALASSKCSSQADADDLVSETMLAAFTFIHKGGSIEHPKSWLAGTLMHIHNSTLRKKYRMPSVVNLDLIPELTDEYEFETASDTAEEEARVRKELNFLAKTTREVIIHYYYGLKSIGEIAKLLSIPEGTVKSRLFSGRKQIKKGIVKMDIKANRLPAHLFIYFSGSDNGPRSLVESDLIKQNILIHAYEKPLTITELSHSLGIPSAYVEPIVDTLVENELMAATENGRFYTDFIIQKPEDRFCYFDEQQKFVSDRFDVFEEAIKALISEVNELSFTETLNPRQRRKLERFAVMDMLQRFELNGSGKSFGLPYPKRKDGGAWLAGGNMIPADYDENKYKHYYKYMVNGGHRTSSRHGLEGAKYIELHEFDTFLWDHPSRFNICGYADYFANIHELLWCIYNNKKLEATGIKNEMIERIPNFAESSGLISYEEDKLIVDIAVLTTDEYRQVIDIIESAKERLISAIGEDYINYLKGKELRVPAHLKSIAEFARFNPATNFLVMTVVHKAYENGIHLHDVDYCCPPCVLVYKKN